MLESFSTARGGSRKPGLPFWCLHLQWSPADTSSLDRMCCRLLAHTFVLVTSQLIIAERTSRAVVSIRCIDTTRTPRGSDLLVLTHITSNNVQSEVFGTEAAATARFNVLDNGALAAMLVDGDFNELDFYANDRGRSGSCCVLNVRSS